MPTTLPQVLVTLAVALLTSAIIPAILSFRKTRAETKKTGVDAAAVLSDTAIDLMTELRTELSETRKEVKRLRKMVASMRAALIEYGADIKLFEQSPDD